MIVKYRLKFNKLEKMKYIGHLDLLNILQRSIKRAGLPIAYSEGFNPHQQMSFALPLPIGMESIGEYVDITLDTNPEEDMKEGFKALNETLPSGLSVLSTRMLLPNEKSAAALVEGADYRIYIPDGISSGQMVDKLKYNDKIVVMKKTKSGETETDIKPDIHMISIVDGSLAVRLSAGGKRMLKPQLLMEYLSNEMELGSQVFKYVRIDLLQYTNGRFVALSGDEHEKNTD